MARKRRYRGRCRRGTRSRVSEAPETVKEIDVSDSEQETAGETTARESPSSTSKEAVAVAESWANIISRTVKVTEDESVTKVCETQSRLASLALPPIEPKMRDVESLRGSGEATQGIPDEERKGIYIPPPLRNRQFGAGSVDVRSRENKMMNWKEKEVMKVSEVFYHHPVKEWSPWQGRDYLSDVLISLKRERDTPGVTSNEPEGKQFWLLLQSEPSQTFWSSPPLSYEAKSQISSQVQFTDWQLWRTPTVQSQVEEEYSSERFSQMQSEYRKSRRFSQVQILEEQPWRSPSLPKEPVSQQERWRTRSPQEANDQWWRQ